MATDSRTAGYLLPTAESTHDDALDDLLHDVIVGLTGITGDLVRPRWQPEPPQQPEFSVTWVAFGVSRTEEDTFGYEHHDPLGEGPTTVERDELLYYAHSFYGPHASGMCKRLRDGLQISQNRDALLSAGLGVVEVKEAVKIPALLHQKWVPKVDVTVVYRRRSTTAYPVLTIKSATVDPTIETLGTTHVTVNP